MKKRVAALFLTVCIGLFTLASCQGAFGEDGKLPEQEIYRLQKEFGTAGGLKTESGNSWMILQDAVLLVKLVQEEPCYLSITSQGEVTVKKERPYTDSLYAYPARIWTLRVLGAVDGALQEEEKIIRVLDLTGAVTGSLADAPVFELGQVFICGVSGNVPQTAGFGGEDAPPYITFQTVVYRIAPGGYVFRCDPDIEDTFDGYRLDLFFNFIRLIRAAD